MSRAASKPLSKPENVVALPAGLHRITTDGDGESSVTFKIPLTGLDEITKLAKWTGKLLTLYVKREAEGK